MERRAGTPAARLSEMFAETCVAYLHAALSMAERGRWRDAEENARTAEQFARIVATIKENLQPPTVP